MTMYCIPREEFVEAIKTIGPFRLWSFVRDDGSTWDAIAFWDERNQAVDMLFKQQEAA